MTAPMIDLSRLPRSMDDLLTADEHAELNAHLDDLAKLRRRVEAESRNIALA